ncbi:MAG: UvrD-helicase domain-containing protein, partial [Alphaproteobacteria bacterium]|nr:UvrD-helicase domain-containing protein [Alphaproteobacteria bacterium]
MVQKRELSSEQATASDPAQNIWVQANAGTGKTSVLVQRLLRILFRTEAERNSGILCLTYTNAGAGEMRNRILAALREWAMSDDDELRELLRGVAHNQTPTDEDLSRARAIFYEYIDNPQMLKIRTIHGFCEEILRRFPLEAGVSPAWNLVSDANQKRLLSDTFHKLINSSMEQTTHDAFAQILGQVSEYSLDELLGILTGQYKQFFKVENFINYRNQFIDTTIKYLNLNSPIQIDISPEKLKKIIEITELDIKSSKKPASYLINIVNLSNQLINNTINFEKYQKAYLTATGSKIVHVSKKDYLQEEQDRVHSITQHESNQQIFKDTVALFDLSSAFAQCYKKLKSERNLLDFDDLILYTRQLFANPESMGWILSQLDLSLSHILVDEAQDTSPEQWEILKSLSSDFFTDGDREENPRSLFVVGDTKQSIYRFQGADPNAFATSRTAIADNIKNNLR